MAVRTAGQLRPVNSTICITPYCFLCNRITCLRRSCSSARLCLRASSSLIGKVMNCVATTIKISLGRVYRLHVRAGVFSENRPGPIGLLALEEERQAHGGENPCDDRTVEKLARNHRAGGQVEQRLTRLGELLCGRHSPESVPGSRQLRRDAVAPVVALQAQSQAAQGRDLSTLAPLRALRARSPDQA